MFWPINQSLLVHQGPWLPWASLQFELPWELVQWTELWHLQRPLKTACLRWIGHDSSQVWWSIYNVIYKCHIYIYVYVYIYISYIYINVIQISNVIHKCHTTVTKSLPKPVFFVGSVSLSFPSQSSASNNRFGPWCNAQRAGPCWTAWRTAFSATM